MSTLPIVNHGYKKVCMAIYYVEYGNFCKRLTINILQLNDGFTAVYFCVTSSVGKSGQFNATGKNLLHH